jgi:hypothetical protein
MRQKASAEPERSAAATEKVVVDFMFDMCGWRYQGLGRRSAIVVSRASALCSWKAFVPFTVQV